MSPVILLLSALVLCGAWLVRQWRAAVPEWRLPNAVEALIGFVTNFFDTLGIGSFATTTTMFRLLRLVPDELIPGTLIIGHALPVVVQALFFISAIDVEPWQMTWLIVACIAGGWVGAGVVAGLSRRAVQLGMGSALLVAAVFMLLGMTGLMPAGGAALALSDRAFALALALNVIFGALLTLGIGNYAPSLVLFSLLGMDPRAAFPIMMGSGAFVATIAGVRFVRSGRFASRVALGLALGGIPGVIIAAWLVKSLPLDIVRWLVLVVVIYAAASLFRAAAGRRP